MNFTNFDIMLMAQIQHFFKGMDRVALVINVFEICVLVRIRSGPCALQGAFVARQGFRAACRERL